MTRDIAIPGYANLRDTGGYVAATGITQPRRLLRADYPFDWVEASGAAIARIHVTQVIDLRGHDETAESPSPYPGLGIAVTQIPLFTGSAASIIAAGGTLATLYAHLIETAGSAFSDVARTVARTGTGTTLLHCSAGKDRTGVAVALLLDAAGVNRDDIIADYADTERHLRGEWVERRIAQLQQHHTHDLRDSIDLLAGSPADAIEHAIDLVDASWGGSANYLSAHGLGDADLDALVAALLTPAASENPASPAPPASPEGHHG